MTKTVPAKKNFLTSLNEIKVICKTKNVYMLLVFLSIMMALLIAVFIAASQNIVQNKKNYYRFTTLILKDQY